MAKKKSEIADGFVPRRPLGGRGAVPDESGLRPSTENNHLSHAGDDPELSHSSLSPHDEGGLSRNEIDASLNEIEDEQGHGQARLRNRRKPLKKKKFIKRILLLVVLLIVAAGIFLGIKFLQASESIFQGNILGFVQTQPLREDANGRSNIVLFGTSEDNEGGTHPGAWLTDSIMVISLDQDKKDAFTFSIPRDLWVEYGQACAAGYEGRINALYQCYSNQGQDEEAGTAALRRVLRTVTGLDIQYYVHVNYSVVRDVVDAVGGVDVDIQSDPVSVGGVLDRNFDWKCNYTCYYVKYDNGVHHLDGEHALALARARGDNNGQATYGLSRSNYDREINQQKIAVALKEKALSAGTLTNFGKISNLLDALGKNLRTNFDTSEIRTLMGLGEDIPSESITRLTLVDADPAVFVNDSVNGASIVRSTDGFNEYDSIIDYLQRQLSSDPVVREDASVGVFNGTEVAGLAQQNADTLSEKNFNVAYIGNALKSDYTTHKIYDLSGGKMPKTVAKLESLYGVTATTEAAPFATTGIDVVLIVAEPESN